MEIDRIRPNDDYQLDNIVLSCYWCNNSKTDEYSQEEFCLIQSGITMVWNQRLKAIGKEPISKEGRKNGFEPNEVILFKSVTRLFSIFWNTGKITIRK